MGETRFTDNRGVSVFRTGDRSFKASAGLTRVYKIVVSSANA